MIASEGRRRVVIEHVEPEIDGGRFPIKRVVGEKVVVQADIFADGHDSVSARLLYREQDDREDELEILLEAFLLEKAVYELGYELNNRPDWVIIPIGG